MAAKNKGDVLTWDALRGDAVVEDSGARGGPAAGADEKRWWESAEFATFNSAVSLLGLIVGVLAFLHFDRPITDWLARTLPSRLLFFDDWPNVIWRVVFVVLVLLLLARVPRMVRWWIRWFLS